MGADVVTGAPTHLALGPLVAAVAEWVAEAAETTVHLSVAATTRRLRVRGLAAGMARIGPSITRPGPGTEVKPAARVRSMKKSPRDGGREVQRPAVRVVPVTSVIQTRRTTRNPTPRMALTTPTPLAPCHLHRPEAPRPGSSHPGVSPRGGAGAEAAEEETSIGAVAMLEDHLGDIELDPTLAPMVDLPSHQPHRGNSRARHKALGPKTWAGEGTVQRKRTR